MLSRFLFVAALQMTTLIVVVRGRCAYPVASRAVKMRIASAQKSTILQPREMPVVALRHCAACGIYASPVANPCRNLSCELN